MGEYFEAFGNLEMMLSVAFAKIVNQPVNFIQFMWKDVFISQKIKTVRRAARETFGDEGARWLALRPVLKDMDTALEFRNDLAHGAFLREGGGAGMKFGKPGQSMKELFKGFEGIDYEKIQSETSTISSINRRLVDWTVADIGSRKS